MEHFAGTVWELVPAITGFDDSFHEGNAFDGLGMRMCPMETQTGTPVMDDQCDVVGDAQLFKQSKQIFAVFDEGIAVRARVIELVTIAHANQVWRDQASLACKVGHHIAPQIGRHRVAMQEDNRIAGPFFDIGHLLTMDGGKFLFVAERRSHASTSGLCLSRGRCGRTIILKQG